MVRSLRAAVLIFAAFGSAPLAAAEQPLTALAPFETYADGFSNLRGIAVDATGNVYVADRAAGAVWRIAPDRTRTAVATNLDRPIGLALDANGRLLVAEEHGARVVRIEANGSKTTLVSGIKQPRWLAVHDDGTIYMSARRLTRGTDPEPDDESAEPEMILALSPAGALSVVADGFKQLQGLAANHDALFAATQGRRQEPRVDGVVFRIPILPVGAGGTPVQVGPNDDFKKPIGLARDRLGALYLTSKELTLQEDRSKRAVAKVHPDGRVSLFAENLEHPQGLAFDAAGNLYVADGHAGRVLKFRAPVPPTVTVPGLTRLSPLAVTGTTEPGARVDLFVNDAVTPASVVADAAGHFTRSVALHANAANALETFATAHGGDGLTSASARTTVVHDAIAPALAFQAPPANAHVRGIVSVKASASDAHDVAALTLTVDGSPLGVALDPAPPASAVAATVAWNTLSVADGSHTLGATATDAAGNTATTSRLIVVDNTPPDTEITSGPTGAITGTSATFGFTGTDNLTPVANLEFAWRLDGGAFSVFSTATSAALTALGAAPHTFEVKARDRAGNEDPTPAGRAFSVGSALSVTITEPANGAVVPAGLALVRGIVNASGEVSVSVNGVPAAVDGSMFAVMVPVSPDTAIFTAMATSAGATASHEVTILVVGQSTLALIASPASGPAPLTVTFALAGGDPNTVTLDFDGDGTLDFAGSGLEDQAFVYPRPGLFIPTATAVDTFGNRVTLRTVVTVFDTGALDTLLQGKWTSMRNALRAGDIAGAVTHIMADKRGDYAAAFQAIAVRLPMIDTILTDLTLVEVRDRAVIYHATRIDDGVTKAFRVRFAIDDDGVWQIDSL